MRAHAEVEKVWPRDGGIRVEGHVHGRRVRTAFGWQLLLVLRACDRVRLHYDTVLRGPRFDVAVPLGDLVPPPLPTVSPGHHATRPGDSAAPSGPRAAGPVRPGGPARPGPAAALGTWDLHLVDADLPAGRPLRLGRRLDDIENKKKIMVFPAQQIDVHDGAVLVRPFYTIYGNLSVECRRVRTAEWA